MTRAPDAAKSSRSAARRDRERKASRQRPLWIALSLAGVLALQLWTCRDRLGLPFLDTRLHYDYDNADFSFRARSGNRNGDLRSQFGVTLNTYSRWGERTGTKYYTDHPFLVKTVFQQYTRLAGTTESASRSFYLAVSFAIAAGLYVILLQTTGSLLAALAGAATLVSFPLFSLYQTSVKFEADGMLAGVWLFVALMACLRSRTQRSLTVYGVLVGLAFLVHWTAILFVGTLAAYLIVVYARSRNPTTRAALLATIAGGILGTATLLAAMTWLQGGWGAARAALVRAYATRSTTIPAATWWERQWLYSRMNFSDVLPWVVLGISLFLAARWFWSRSREPIAPLPTAPMLALFIASTLTVACVWQFAFPQGSFIHVYWQYWFCLPIAALVAAFVVSLRTSRFGFAAALAACGVLALHLSSASRAAYAGIVADQLGTPDDIALLISLREDSFDRMVFVPLSDLPLNQWFQGPLFEYYTDRPVIIAATEADVRTGSKALVLRYQQREDVVARLSAWSHKKLTNEKCGQRLCAYDVLEP